MTAAPCNGVLLRAFDPARHSTSSVSLVVDTIAEHNRADVCSGGKQTLTAGAIIIILTAEAHHDADTADLDDAFGGLAEQGDLHDAFAEPIDRCIAHLIVGGSFQDHVLRADQRSARRTAGGEFDAVQRIGPSAVGISASADRD
jgi:hypothetical protein